VDRAGSCRKSRHLGGRWWIDENGDGEMDEGDAYFSRTLLGPGCEAP
jgi:hypothetical protein